MGCAVLGLILTVPAVGAAPEPGPAQGRAVALDQFTITLPPGWYVHDQSAALGRPGPQGVIVFASVDLATLSRVGEHAMTDEAAKRTMVEIDSGKLPSFFVDRYAAATGVTCAGGLPESVRENLMQDFLRSARGPNGNWVVNTQKVENVTVGGCRGLRILVSSTILEGGRFNLLAYVVADGRMTYDFTLRNRNEFFEKNLPVFEKAISTLKLKPPPATN